VLTQVLTFYGAEKHQIALCFINFGCEIIGGLLRIGTAESSLNQLDSFFRLILFKIIPEKRKLVGYEHEAYEIDIFCEVELVSVE